MVPACTKVHFWATVPLQPQIWILLPLAVFCALLSRHMPLAFTSALPLPVGGGFVVPPPVNGWMISPAADGEPS